MSDNALGVWRAEWLDGLSQTINVETHPDGEFVARTKQGSFALGKTARQAVATLFEHDPPAAIHAPDEASEAETAAFQRGVEAMRAASVRISDDRVRDRAEATEKSMDAHDYGCASCQAAARGEAKYIAAKLRAIAIDPKGAL